MKRILFACIALATLAGASGCRLGGCNDCNSCNGGGCGLFGGCHPCGLGQRLGGIPNDGQAQAVAGGPPSAQVAYPYYTTRGPRDFLNPNPPSIGY